MQDLFMLDATIYIPNPVLTDFPNRLNTTELDYNIMFALITYKNLFLAIFVIYSPTKGLYMLFLRTREALLKTLVPSKR